MSRAKRLLLNKQETSYTREAIDKRHHMQDTSHTRDIVYKRHHIQYTSYTRDIIYNIHHIRYTSYTRDIRCKRHDLQDVHLKISASPETSSENGEIEIAGDDDVHETSHTRDVDVLGGASKSAPVICRTTAISTYDFLRMSQARATFSKIRRFRK